MPIVSLNEWNQFVASHPNTHLLQTGEWGELKSAFGWKPVRLISGGAGVQVLFRKLPLGFTVGYIPKAVIGGQYSVNSGRSPVVGEELLKELDVICRKHRAIFYKLEPDFWIDQTPDTRNLTLRTCHKHHLMECNEIIPGTDGDSLFLSEANVITRLLFHARQDFFFAI